MPQTPLCFVIMPFGKKEDPGSKNVIDFDRIYKLAIEPAVQASGMTALRADEEKTGGIIHKAMFERLILCDYAIADLTTANANVFYELGVRHATRPHTTLTMFADHQKQIPFDVNYLRSLPYDMGPNQTFDDDHAQKLKDDVVARLLALKDLARSEAQADSPVFQLVKGYPQADIARLKTDTFRNAALYAEEIKSQLSQARGKNDLNQLKSIEMNLGDLGDTEAGVLIDLFLSYRAVKAHKEMIRLFDCFPVSLKSMVMVREQYAFALNRDKQHQEALSVLNDILAEHGPSSETCGIQGRVYKDLWQAALEKGQTAKAAGLLKSAIASYVEGFEVDWRDAYPGINAVTLLDIADRQDEKNCMLPVVTYAVKRRISTGKPDFWDHATLLELAVLDGNEDAAREHLADALAAQRERWEPETTANNLKMIEEARKQRGNVPPWLKEIIAELDQAALG